MSKNIYKIISGTRRTLKQKEVLDVFTCKDQDEALDRFEQYAFDRAELYELLKMERRHLVQYLGREPKASELGFYSTRCFPFKQVRAEKISPLVYKLDLYAGNEVLLLCEIKEGPTQKAIF